MLISNSAVGCWTITRRAAKLKPPAVKQKSFELEREVLRSVSTKCRLQTADRVQNAD